MKKKKGLIILIVCLVALVGVYFVATYISDKINYIEPATTVDKSVNIWNISTKVSAVRVINSYGDNTYYMDEEGKWKVEGNEVATLSQSMVQRMAIYGGNLTATEKVDDTCDNLAKYGLDKPQYTIILRQNDGTESVFYIGMQNQVTEDFYIYADGVDGIYTVGSTFPGYFNFDVEEFFLVEDILVTTDTSYLRELSMEYEDNSWHLVRMHYGSDYDVSGTRAWYLVDLFEHEVAVDTSKLEDIQNAYLELGIYSCITFSATDDELAKVGLRPGDCKGSIYYYFEEASVSEEITEKTVVGSQKIWLGNKTEDGAYYYVRPDGREGIYTMEATYIDQLRSNTAENLLQKYISVINISTVDSYSVEIGDIHFEAKVESIATDTGVEYYHYHNDKKLEKKFGSNLYTSLIGVYAEKALLKTEEPSGEELLKITFYRNTDIMPVYEVSFYAYSINYYKVAVNGEVSYLANSRDYKALVESISSSVENITYATEE
ncbi:MAG: DUF4340 domain-containing protein [Lachnospiraceae bacterium]|nr:DUF4340 domain-containing protein [Lachnospiraceae bacterium]